MATTETTAPAAERTGLRRGLKLWQVIGLSIGLMAPSMAISLNPQGAVGSVGRAIPLSFLIAMVGALLVSYGFARLSQHFNNSGSVLGLVGATLGARAGVVAGWCLAATYILYALLTSVAAGIFGTILLHDIGIINSEPNWVAYLIGAIVVVLAGAVAAVPADKATDVILSFEGITMALILIAVVIVTIKLVGHSGPGHLHFTMSVFSPSKGTHLNQIFLGVVFGFLSFAGFEAATALGGEAAQPRRDIPRAVVLTVAIIGIFYVVVSAIEVMGFGTSAGGLAAFGKSDALVGTLGQVYVAKWFGDVIIAGTVVSAFGCSMASAVGASRLIFSFARDGVGEDHPVARLSPRFGTPVMAVGIVVVVELVVLIFAGALGGIPPFNLFYYTAEIGTLLILIAYGLVTIGTLLFIFVQPALRREPTKARAAEVILPIAGIVVLVYTLYRSVDPFPVGAARWEPIVAGIWLIIALVGVFVAPSFSRRLGESLVDDEGVELDEAPA